MPFDCSSSCSLLFYYFCQWYPSRSHTNWAVQQEDTARYAYRICHTIGDVNLDVVESYKYQELILSEFLDFSKTAKAAAKSAHRTLGLIIAKAKSFGGLPYNVFYL